MLKRNVTKAVSWLMFIVLISEMLLSINIYATTERTGTLGDNGGFKWTYNEDTKTLVVTGEDTGLAHKPFSSISNDIDKITFKGCVFKGSLYQLLDGMTTVSTVEFDNCDTSKVTDMASMFGSCPNLRSIDLSGFDTSNVKNMAFMFYECSSLKNIDLSGFDTSKVTDMTSMFSLCENLESVDISSFDTSNVKGMAYMFCECNSLEDLNVSMFETSNVTNMEAMFAGCGSVEYLDVKKFDTSQVTSMACMFQNCKLLAELDISGFNTSNVVNMSWTFYCCEQIKTLDTNGFNTSKVTDMSHMFDYCSSLEQLDVSEFDTSNVTNFSTMFASCTSVKELDVSGFVTSKALDMSGMFRDCKSVNKIDVSGFDTSNVTNMFEMFNGCTNIFVLDMSGFDTSKISNIAYMLEKCENLENILTPKKMNGLNISLPHTFYDSNMNPMNELTSEHQNLKLVRNKVQDNTIVTPSNKYRIKVIDSSGRPVSNAEVMYGVESAVTNENGEVFFEKSPLGKNENIMVKKENYILAIDTVNKFEKDDLCSEVVLYRLDESNLNLKYANYSTGGLNTINILTSTKTINLKNKGNFVGDLTTGDFIISCESINKEDVLEYQLWQKNNFIARSKDGVFSLNVEDGFVKGGNCYIRVVSNDIRREDIKINLYFEENKVVEENGISFMDEKLTIAVKDDVPFFGGRELEIDMPDFPVEIEKTEDKFYIGINTTVKEYGGDKDSYFEQLKQKIESVGEAFDVTDKEKLQKYIKKNKDLVMPGGEFDISLVGYAECDKEEKVAKGDLYICVSGETPSVGFSTMVWIIPVTVQFSASVEGGVNAEIKYDFEEKKFSGDLTLDAEIACKVIGAIGFGENLHIGPYGEATLIFELKIIGDDPGLKKLDLKGEMGISVAVGSFRYEKVYAHNTWHLYTPTSNEGGSGGGGGSSWGLRDYSESLADEPTEISYGIYNSDNYKIESLEYLKDESEWCGYPGMLNDVDVKTNFVSLVENTYLNAQPVMVTCDDILYASFLGADATTGEIYVQCTKMENGVWCEPVRVDNNAILDDAPRLMVDEEGNIWLAYAKTNEAFDGESLLSYANNQSIVVGMLDKETLEFVELKEYDSTDYEHLHHLSVVNGVPTLSWLESEVTDDDSVLASMNHKIVWASYSDDEWSESEVIKEINTYIGDLAIGDIGIAYLIDTDDDLSTKEDQTVVYCDWQGNEKNTITGVTGNITYGKLPGEVNNTFIWNDKDKLCSMDGSVEVVGITNEYVINNNSIYYNISEKNGSELAVIRMNNDGTFGNPIQLTDTDRYIEDLSVANVLGKDIVLGMHTSAEITEDSVNTAKNLVWSIVQPVNDIRIDGIDYDLNVTTPDETLEVKLTVTNAGENEINEVKIYLDENVISTQNITLQPGESKEIMFEMAYPSVMTEYTVKIEDTAIDLLSDYNSDDNSRTFKLGRTNIKVDASLRKLGDSKTVVAKLTNNGTDVASGTVALFSEDGQLLSLSSFSDLERENTLLIDMPLHFDISDSTLSVVVNTEQEEIYTYDNVDTVYIPAEAERYIVAYELDGGVQNSENLDYYYESDEVIELFDPTKDGYVFEGWYSNSDYTEKVTEIDTAYAEDITLYAKWNEELNLSISAPVDKTQVKIGDRVVISATATGGDGNYTYSFLVHNKDTKQWVRLTKSFTESNNYTWKAISAGNREFFIEVKDGTGKVVRSEALNINTVNKLSITGEASSSIISVGDSIELFATATGGSGDYTYSYLVHNKDTRKWSRLTKEFVENNCHTWKATSIGNRQFFIEVKDSEGNIVRSKAINVNVVDKLSVTASSTAPSVVSGESITISSEVTGGIGEYTYSFIVYNRSTKKWYRLADNINSTKYTWKAGSSGERVFYVDVKDSTGKIVRSKAVEVNVE